MRMAGIEVIDSALTKQSIDLARTHLSPYLFNHVIRSWLMSTLAASGVKVKPDPEVLACATILHDLGLTQKYEANDRFEVDGANAARAFLRGHGMKERDLQLVWDSIALHTTPSIAIHKEPEVVCCLAGIGADIIGFGLERFKPEDRRTQAPLCSWWYRGRFRGAIRSGVSAGVSRRFGCECTLSRMRCRATAAGIAR